MKDVWRVVRWGLAIGLLGWCLVFLFRGAFEVCSSTVVDGKSQSECRPPTVSDAAVVAVGLGVGVLIFPELAEFGVFGISLKRRVQEVADKAEVLEGRIELHDLRMENLALATASASAQVNNNSYYLTTPEQVSELEEQLASKGEAWRSGTAPSQPRTVSRPKDSGSDSRRNEFGMQLIANWEELANKLALRPLQGDWVVLKGGGAADVPLDERRRFVSLFRDELDVVRSARNNVAHARPLPEDELRAAAGISSELLRILNGGTESGAD